MSANHMTPPSKLEVTPSSDWQGVKLEWPALPSAELINGCAAWSTATTDLGLHGFPADMTSMAMAPTPDASELNWSPAPVTPSAEQVLDFKWNNVDFNDQDAALGIWLLNFIGDQTASIDSINEIYHKLQNPSHPSLMAATPPVSSLHGAAESMLLGCATTSTSPMMTPTIASSPSIATEQRMPDSEPLVSVMQRLSVQPESAGAITPSSPSLSSASPSTHLALEMARAAVMAQFQSTSAASSAPLEAPTPLHSVIDSPMANTNMMQQQQQRQQQPQQPFYPLALFPADGSHLPIARPGSPSAIGRMTATMAVPSSMASASMAMSLQSVNAPVAVALNHPNGVEMPGLRLQPVPIHPATAAAAYHPMTINSSLAPHGHALQSGTSPFGVSPLTIDMASLSGSFHATPLPYTTTATATATTANANTGTTTLVSSIATNGTRRDANHRPFVCQECQKRFARPSALRLHMRTHSGERPHACTHAGCGRRFSVQSNLTRHLRLHARRGGFSPRETRRSGSQGAATPTIRESIIPSRHCHTLIPSRMASQPLEIIATTNDTNGNNNNNSHHVNTAAATSYVEGLAAIFNQNPFV